MSIKKKILAIALEGERKVQALASYEEEHLTVVEMNDITGNPDEWLDAMHHDIAKKAQNGWVIMVEDRTHSFPGDAVSFNFDALCEDGRTYLQCSLDWYFSMQARGQLILETHMERYNMRLGGEGSLLDAKHDEKGRIVYSVNWREFTSGHKALLMCVAGAVMEDPVSSHWIEAMTGARKRGRIQVESPLNTFIAAMNVADSAAQRMLEQRHIATEERKDRNEKGIA